MNLTNFSNVEELFEVARKKNILELLNYSIKERNLFFQLWLEFETKSLSLGRFLWINFL